MSENETTLAEFGGRLDEQNLARGCIILSHVEEIHSLKPLFLLNSLTVDFMLNYIANCGSTFPAAMRAEIGR